MIKNKLVNIAILSPSLDPTNGYGNITQSLIQHLSSQYKISVLFPKNQKIPHKKTLGVKYFNVLPEFIHNVKDKRIIQYILWNLYTNINYDLIYSIDAFPYGMLARKLAKKMNIPYVIGTQGTYAIYPLTIFPEKILTTNVYNDASAIHSPSKFTKEMILKLSKIKKTVSIIHNGINFSDFQSNGDRIQNHDQTLLSVGALKPRKGFDIVIKAIALLKKDYPEIQYLIAGEGSDRKYLEDLIALHKLKKNIHLLGHTNRGKTIKLMQQCSIYIHTPRMDGMKFEGYGIVYLEASACGKATIGSLSGGVSDAITQGKTGLLVPENNPEETAASIRTLLENKSFMAQLGKEGKKWARRHDWSIISKQIMNLWENTVR